MCVVDPKRAQQMWGAGLGATAFYHSRSCSLIFFFVRSPCTSTERAVYFFFIVLYTQWGVFADLWECASATSATSLFCVERSMESPAETASWLAHTLKYVLSLPGLANSSLRPGGGGGVCLCCMLLLSVVSCLSRGPGGPANFPNKSLSCPLNCQQ